MRLALANYDAPTSLSYPELIGDAYTTLGASIGLHGFCDKIGVDALSDVSEIEIFQPIIALGPAPKLFGAVVSVSRR